MVLVLLVLLPALAGWLAFQGPARSGEKTKPAAKLELKPGDHICIIGNTLAERMQHDGWLETYLYSRFPKHNLVFRNLGFSGDELTVRPRSMDFGTPDQWLSGSAPIPQPKKLNADAPVRKNRFELTNTKADVIFAFFGYSESFAGEAGLEKFKKDLESFIKHTLAQKYNGKSAPRLVLFSPSFHEKLPDPNLPDPAENNQRLALYAKAMADVARANEVPFVDLFTATSELERGQPMTINGIHLNEYGNMLVASLIDRALFGDRDPVNSEQVDKIRKAVVDKNFYWYHRYRTTDGYSTYGDRAFLRFTGGQTNYEVLQRELEILDAMTANRDQRIWAVAQGGDLKVDDKNTPAFVNVPTNKTGAGPQGAHLFLSGEEAIKKMTVHKNMKVNLFASEKEFPELANPVQMSFDAKGRLWVAVWPTYPHWRPREPMNDKLIILEDTDGDGKADTCKVFADHLHNPTGFEFWNGGVLVGQGPDLLFLKDTDGDDKADVRTRVLHGLDTADTHHTANSFVLDPGGGLYWQEGVFHRTQVETPHGPVVRRADAGVYRYEPRTHKFDVYVAFGFANPHGHVFDRWGSDFVVDGTGANPWHAALFSGHLDYPHGHSRPPQLYQQKTRPCPGMEILSSRHFPKDNQGNLLVANVIGYHGILQYKFVDKGSSFEGIEVEPILSSSDQNFRPSDIRVGPDGAIYFIDWQNPIIGHMQHNLRDPSRDRSHGRVYRVTYNDRPLSKPEKIAGESIGALLDLLKHPEDRVRYRARIELGGRDTKSLMHATKKWIEELDEKDADHEHHMIEALWLHQNHNVVNADLLKRMLSSKDFRARAAATRVLCHWRDPVPGVLELLKKQAADSHPRVRLEAVRAASFFKSAEAVEVVLISAEHPGDPYLDFLRGETMRALDPHVQKALAQGKQIPVTSLAGARYFLKNVNTDRLVKMERSKAVYLELLSRKGVRDEFRQEAIAGLGKLDNKAETAVLLDAVKNQESGVRSQESGDGVVFDLIRLLTSRSDKELAGIRGELEAMASAAKSPVTRQLGYIALIGADHGVDKAWTLASQSAAGLQDLVSAMPLLRDPTQRAELYPKVEPLLRGLPKALAVSPAGKAVQGRYVRIELPGKLRTLTLAEVEVFSDGRNVARNGKAKQSSTAHGGVAGRAIDGNKSGSFGAGGQTHTAEGTENPWWEVDLGAEAPINAITIYNRTDGNLGIRLDRFSLQVLDQARRVVFERTKQPAPAVQAHFEVSGLDAERIVRHAAMHALTSVRGQEATTFKALKNFVNSDADRPAAIQALQRIPTVHWPKEDARPLLDSLLVYIRKVPVAERTSPAALDAMQLGDSLASLLPLKEARLVRKELGELGVPIIRIGTIPDQMQFDKERIVVKAGKQVEILFENTDLMPHNLVITEPGSLEEIGNLAEASATQPGALERHYVPPSKKVLVASRLLPPRDVQRIGFTAPTKPGVYPIVCTYPGHWRRMFGAMYVVDDLDEYLADAEKYLGQHPLAIADELLKFNRPRTDWKVEELASAVDKMDHGRSFGNGKQMFQVANCIACHKMNGVGVEMGPDLAKLDPKLKRIDILRDILEPSFKINEKFQSFTFETNDGKVITGLVLEETKEMVKVIENPLLKTAPLILKISDIAERKKSPTSIMPKALLNTLTREEILDLIAYVIARGDPRHPVFQGAHEHGHKGH